MSTADPHPAPNDPTLPPLNDPVEEDDKNTHGTPGGDEDADTASGGSPD